MRLGERRRDARHVADAERDGHRVVAAVGERQRLGVGLDEVDGVVEPALGGALAPDREHVGVDVDHGGAGAGAARRDHPERDVAGAAGEVEQRERLRALSAD